MKKNKMMRIASCLLVLVLLTTCVISGTFAKYVTSSGELTDSATVAKWGIVLTVAGDNVLYDDTVTGNEVTSLKVYTENLAAPGTHQKLAKVQLSGTPEVAYKIIVDVDLTLVNWVLTDGTTEYLPLVFNVDGDEIKIDATFDTVAKVEKAVEEAIAAAIAGAGPVFADEVYSKEHNPNIAVPTSANDVEISWTWAFSSSSENDAKDTELGDPTTLPTIGFSLKVTVEQVD